MICICLLSCGWWGQRTHPSVASLAPLGGAGNQCHAGSSFISEGRCRTRYPGDGENTSGCEPRNIVSRLLQDDPSVSSSLKKNCICFWLCWSFIALHVLSLVVLSGGHSSCGMWASHRGAQALGRVGFSSCGSQALEHRHDSCDPSAQLPRRM